MSHVEVRIATDNAAFRDADGELFVPELHRLLDVVAQHLASGFREGHLRDLNGARCGEFAVVEDGP